MVSQWKAQRIIIDFSFSSHPHPFYLQFPSALLPKCVLDPDASYRFRQHHAAQAPAQAARYNGLSPVSQCPPRGAGVSSAGPVTWGLIFSILWFLFLMPGLWTCCDRCWNDFPSDMLRPHLLPHSGLCSNITSLERLTSLPANEFSFWWYEKLGPEKKKPLNMSCLGKAIKGGRRFICKYISFP